MPAGKGTGIAYTATDAEFSSPDALPDVSSPDATNGVMAARFFKDGIKKEPIHATPPPPSLSLEARLAKMSIPSDVVLPVTTGGRAKKCRQHVNPLSDFYSTPLTIDAGWFAREFAEPSLPLTVDIGSAFGGWCLDAASLPVNLGTRNFIGLEIRHPAADTAQQRRDQLGLVNCTFLRANANIDLDAVFAAARAARAPIERVLMQFPDPWFKRRHRKRRVISHDLAASIARSLAEAAASHPAPLLYLASDVLAVAAQMRHVFLTESTCVRLLRDESEAEGANGSVGSAVESVATREPPSGLHAKSTSGPKRDACVGRDASAPVAGAGNAEGEDKDEGEGEDEDEGEGEEDVVHFDASSWLATSPLEVATEREKAVLKGLGATSTVNGACFRACFRVCPRAGGLSHAPRHPPT